MGDKTMFENVDKYKILWHSPEGIEIVDYAKDLNEAEYLVNEYRIAYGGVVYYKHI